MLAAEPIHDTPRRWHLTPAQRAATLDVLASYDDYLATIDRYPERRRALEEMVDRLPWLRPVVQSGVSKPTERLGTALAVTDEEYAEAVKRVAQTNAVLWHLERHDRLGRKVAEATLLASEWDEEIVARALGMSRATLYRHRAELLWRLAVGFGFAREMPRGADAH